MPIPRNTFLTMLLNSTQHVEPELDFLSNSSFKLNCIGLC